MEKIYRVKINEKGIPDFSTAEPVVQCGECKKADTIKCPFYSAKWGYTDDDFCSESDRESESDRLLKIGMKMERKSR